MCQKLRFILCKKISAVFPRSLNPFHIVVYYIKWVKTSWPYSNYSYVYIYSYDLNCSPHKKYKDRHTNLYKIMLCWKIHIFLPSQYICKANIKFFRKRRNWFFLNLNLSFNLKKMKEPLLQVYLLSQLLDLHGELLAVAGVLPLGRLLALNHLHHNHR